MITLFSIVSFIVMVYGMFTILDISILEMTKNIEVFLNKEKTDIKSKLSEKETKKKGIRGIIKETYTILELMDEKEKLDYIWIASLILFILGILISASFSNLFLIPVLALGLGLMPFWYVLFKYISFRKRINEELETALSTITTSYIRSDNIVGAISENIEYIDKPIKNTFEYFLNQTRLITSNTKLAIENMKGKINNDIFKEWCDVLIACQDNRNLKHTLVPVVSKLSDTRVVSAQLDTILYEPIKEFISMIILLLANIPIVRILNKEWYEILIKTSPGKFVLTLIVLSVFISINAVVRLSRPIEYKS